MCSFTILFVELACIRWIPAYIRYLGYFTNFVLLGSFLGIGLGILQARRRVDMVALLSRRRPDGTGPQLLHLCQQYWTPGVLVM